MLFGIQSLERVLVDNTITINPSKLEVGIPITILISKKLLPKEIRQIEIQSQSEKIVSPLSEAPNDSLVTQFALYQAGTYKVYIGSEVRDLVVHSHTDLSFAIEFWALFLTVISIFGGMVIWSRKKKIPVGTST